MTGHRQKHLKYHFDDCLVLYTIVYIFFLSCFHGFLFPAYATAQFNAIELTGQQQGAAGRNLGCRVQTLCCILHSVCVAVQRRV